jgi:hypothetical protein
MPERRFPPPWTFDEAKHACFIVRDGNRFPVAYVYFESEPGRRAAAHLMSKDEARKIAADIFTPGPRAGFFRVCLYIQGCGTLR